MTAAELLRTYSDAHHAGRTASGRLRRDAPRLIAHALKVLGCTQAELAERLGMTSVHLSNLKRRRTPMTLAVAAKLHELTDAAVAAGRSE